MDHTSVKCIKKQSMIGTSDNSEDLINFKRKNFRREVNFILL